MLREYLQTAQDVLEVSFFKFFVPFLTFFLFFLYFLRSFRTIDLESITRENTCFVPSHENCIVSWTKKKKKTKKEGKEKNFQRKWEKRESKEKIKWLKIWRKRLEKKKIHGSFEARSGCRWQCVYGFASWSRCRWTLRSVNLFRGKRGRVDF